MAATTVPVGVVQRDLWERLRAAGALGLPAAQTRALRLTGVMAEDRLRAAVEEVLAALPILGMAVREHAGEPVMVPAPDPPGVHTSRATGNTIEERIAAATRVLRAARDRAVDVTRGPLARFDIVHLDDDDVVLALTGHALVCDLHSLYAVLGAVVQACFERFRPDDYPAFDRRAARLPLGAAAAVRPRRRWWSERLGRWQDAAAPAVQWPLGGQARTGARLDAACWQELGELTRPVGGNAWLAVLALAAYWWHEVTTRSPLLGGMLNLREVAGVGEVVGPLTDRLVFAADLPRARPRTFPELLLATHAGLLDAVVHHLPYGMVRALAPREAGTEPLGGQLFVHYCPAPRSSTATRGEATLASRGLSIEFFGDAELAGRGQGHGGWEGVACDLALAEDGDGMLLVCEHPSGHDASPERMPHWIAATVRALVADPGGALPGPS